MPRSYSFDHFKVPSAEPRSRSLRRQDKQHLADSRHPRPPQEEGIHYGKSHAETEEILKARAMAPPPETLQADSSRQVPGRACGRSGAPATPRIHRNTTPIGALPGDEELPPRGRVPGSARRGDAPAQGDPDGIGDVGKAAVRLASLPSRWSAWPRAAAPRARLRASEPWS